MWEARRRPYEPPPAPASAAMVYTSSAASLGEPAGTVGTRGQHRIAAPTSRSTTAPSTRASRRCSPRPPTRASRWWRSTPPRSRALARTGGNGGIIIAYLNGRLPAFVDTQVSVVDIEDCVEGHLLAAERGARGQRYVLNGATIHSLRRWRSSPSCPACATACGWSRRRWRARSVAVAEAAYRLRGKTPSVCRARVRTILHGHRYDGSRATRELGLRVHPCGRDLRADDRMGRGRGSRHPAAAGRSASRGVVDGCVRR